MRQNSHFTMNIAFPDLDPILKAGLTIKFFKKIFANKPSYKKVIVSQVHSSRFNFQETVVYKRQECANLGTPIISRVK